MFKENMLVSYDNMNGHIVHIGNTYFTFMPLNSNALILVYKNDWKTVTVL